MENTRIQHRDCGVLAPKAKLRRAVTASVGQAGAQFMEQGQIKVVPYHHVFHHTWRVDVDGVGTLEAYPNRDSLSYLEAFGLQDARTMIRGTLRYPGWSETWARLVQLGLANETVRIPDLAERGFAEVVEMFLPVNQAGPKLDTRVARFLGISPTGKIIENMRWLGLFSDEPTGCPGDTAAAMPTDVLSRKMPLLDHQRDTVVLKHELEVEYPDSDRPAELVTSTMVVHGEPGGMTAMAHTVGLPAALGARMILTGQLPLTGTQIPTHPAIYEPVLADRARHGIGFREEVAPLAAGLDSGYSWILSVASSSDDFSARKRACSSWSGQVQDGYQNTEGTGRLLRQSPALFQQRDTPRHALPATRHPHDVRSAR
jgi:saccharopine dehydrogenase-like NADP-dependent oxidoreductase